MTHNDVRVGNQRGGFVCHLLRSLGLNAFELKNKLASEFQDAGVFVGGFSLVEVLQKSG